MIGANFIYCRPETEPEAASLYAWYTGEGKRVLYYGGGSEIITMCTAGSIAPEVVIDLKGIPALHVLQEGDGVATIGAACTLETIRTSGIFPLLGETGGRVADHTNQCRITLGGNLCGTVLYRETVLPLLLADAELVLHSPRGGRSVSIHDVFNGRMRLLPGEFIVAVRVESQFVRMPFVHIKRTFSEKIGYPAATVAALSIEGTIRAAFSGVCGYPFRNEIIEQVLNERTRSAEERSASAASLLPEPPRADCEGSGPYRLQLLKAALEEAIAILDRGAAASSVRREK